MLRLMFSKIGDNQIEKDHDMKTVATGAENELQAMTRECRIGGEQIKNIFLCFLS